MKTPTNKLDLEAYKLGYQANQRLESRTAPENLSPDRASEWYRGWDNSQNVRLGDMFDDDMDY